MLTSNNEMILVSQRELELLQAISSLVFGEIVDVVVEDQPFAIRHQVTKQQHKLIQLIRGGVQEFDSIQVAEGNPVTATKECTIHNFKCRRKHKFA